MKVELEDAIQQIETINQQLDNPQTSLTGAITLFKQGSKLLTECYKQLTKYEQQIQMLVDDHLVDFTTYDGDPPASPRDNNQNTSRIINKSDE